LDKIELERRTRDFALRLISFSATLPRDRVGDVLGRQLLKSGSSIGANYREANRAESRPDFIHKISLVEKEAAETQYWLDLCLDARIGRREDLEGLRDESTQLLAIFTRIGKTTKAKSRWVSSNSKFAIRNSKS
jgi:four helix bundle protein